MADRARFRRRRALLREKGLCVRCGVEKAVPGRSKCKKCATEIGIKKIVAPSVVYRCEKIGRLERNLALIEEARRAVLDELAALRAPAVRREKGAHSMDGAAA